jgi:hypothetical protein
LQSEDIFGGNCEIKKLFEPLVSLLEQAHAGSLSGDAVEYLIKILEVLLLSLYDTSEFAKGSFSD